MIADVLFSSLLFSSLLDLFSCEGGESTAMAIIAGDGAFFTHLREWIDSDGGRPGTLTLTVIVLCYSYPSIFHSSTYTHDMILFTAASFFTFVARSVTMQFNRSSSTTHIISISPWEMMVLHLHQLTPPKSSS